VSGEWADPYGEELLVWTGEDECYPEARCSRASAMLGRPSAGEIFQVTNFAGPMLGLREAMSWTCG